MYTSTHYTPPPPTGICIGTCVAAAAWFACLPGEQKCVACVPAAFYGFGFSLPYVGVMSATTLSCGTIVALDCSDS